MSSEKIIRSLKILGINSYDQLQEKEIFFWWEKKYIEIQESQKNKNVKSELIIELIEAKEYLEGIDKEKRKKTVGKLLLNDKLFKTSNFNEQIDKKVFESALKKYKSKFNQQSREIRRKRIQENNVLTLKLFSGASLLGVLSLFIIYFHGINSDSCNKETDFISRQKRIQNLKPRKLSFENGEYTGTCLNGKRHGEGKMIWSDGDKYVGGFLNGQKHGRGTYNHSNGDKYVGEYLNGKRHGRGTYYFFTGNGWVGQWSVIKNKKGILVGR